MAVFPRSVALTIVLLAWSTTKRAILVAGGGVASGVTDHAATEDRATSATHDMGINIANFEDAQELYEAANEAYAAGDMVRASMLDYEVAKWLVLNSEAHWEMSNRMLERCLAAAPAHYEAQQLRTYLVYLPEQLKIAINDPKLAKHGAAWQAANNNDKTLAKALYTILHLIDPTDADTAARLGKLLLSDTDEGEGRAHAAIPYLRTAVTLASNSTTIGPAQRFNYLSTLTEALADFGLYQEALAELQQLLEASSDDELSEFELITGANMQKRVLSGLGRDHEALEKLTEFTQEHPLDGYRLEPGSHVIVQDEHHNVGKGIVVVVHGGPERRHETNSSGEVSDDSGGGGGGGGEVKPERVVVEFYDWSLMNGTFLMFGHFDADSVVPYLTTSYINLAQLADSMGHYEMAWRSLAQTKTFFNARRARDATLLRLQYFEAMVRSVVPPTVEARIRGRRTRAAGQGPSADAPAANRSHDNERERERVQKQKHERCMISIVGMPRSGTSLLSMMLGMHSNFVPLGECPEFHSLPSDHLNMSGPSAEWEGRMSGRGPSAWGRALEAQGDLDELAEAVWESMIASCGQGKAVVDREKACLVTKLPADFAAVGVIKTLFPSALVIDMRRDWRDSAMSSFFADMMHHRSAMAHSLTTYVTFFRAYRACIEHWRQLMGPDHHSPILEVWYEDLVSSPEATLTRILDNLPLAKRDDERRDEGRMQRVMVGVGGQLQGEGGAEEAGEAGEGEARGGEGGSGVGGVEGDGVMADSRATQLSAMLSFQSQEYRMRTSSVDQVRKPLTGRSVGRYQSYRPFADPTGEFFDVADLTPGWPEE